jgi:folate-binding protein YgfZ
MTDELREIQLQTGAIVEDNIVTTFGNDPQARMAAKETVALCDRSHWGLLQVSGQDCSRFLHNQTTNNINQLQPGQGCDTIFVTSTARTLDLVTAYLTKDAILLLVSPNRSEQLFSWMDRYIFPMDRVELANLTGTKAIFTLLGPDSQNLLSNLGISDSILTQPEGNHTLVEIDGIELRLAVGSGLGIPGYTLIIPQGTAATIWRKLTGQGAVPLGDRTWEQLRIEQGRPVPDRELTEDYNPLEAGLWHAISFDKGCYIGQETIARLNTYKGVKQRLWGVKLRAPVAEGEAIWVEDSKVGTLTSITAIEEGYFGLAYVRTKAGGEGLTVKVGGASGQLLKIPFVNHEYYS